MPLWDMKSIFAGFNWKDTKKTKKKHILSGQWRWRKRKKAIKFSFQRISKCALLGRPAAVLCFSKRSVRDSQYLWCSSSTSSAEGLEFFLTSNGCPTGSYEYWWQQRFICNPWTLLDMNYKCSILYYPFIYIYSNSQ